MDERTRDPIKITAEDINPRYNWGRHLPVLGTMGVDFEERVDYRRMHRYRLARAQAALDAIHPPDDADAELKTDLVVLRAALALLAGRTDDARRALAEAADAGAEPIRVLREAAAE